MDNISTLKRPKPSDNEEELFQMQEDFIQNKLQPSAKVINLRHLNMDQANSIQNSTTKCAANSNKKQSKFVKSKKQKLEKVSTSQSTGELLNANVKEKLSINSSTNICDFVQNIPINRSKIILGNIIEKKLDVKDMKYNFDTRVNNNSKIAFPEVFVFDNYKRTSDKQSLFSQKCSQRKVADNSTKMECEEEFDKTKNEGSDLVLNSIAEEVHQENLEKLREMTQEEILMEKSKLESSLDPELIKFIKNRRKVKTKMEVNKPDVRSGNLNGEECVRNKKNDSSCYDQAEVMECENNIENVPKPCIEILKEAKNKGWVHLDTVEVDKLQWMQDIAETKEDKSAPDEPYNARFDFKGLLLPYKDESLSWDNGLHHHGEEPERPGYSLQELLQLSRSSIKQHRSIALTTIANILENSSKGWYDKVLSPAPLVTLNQNNFLLLLRFSLDDSVEDVIKAALQALRAFIFNESDEICLDKLFGWNKYKEPTLKPPSSDIKDESTLKDHELVQIDAVSALLRSDIILRIRYILGIKLFPTVGLACALEVLTRLARYSHIVALNIATTPYLLDTIINNLMPLSVSGINFKSPDIPLVESVRLCRVLVYYGGRAVAEKLIRLNIIQCILSYVEDPATTEMTHGIMLRIESYRLWKLLLNHNLATNSLDGIQVRLAMELEHFLSNHDIRKASEYECEYAIAIIAVCSTLHTFKEKMLLLLSKWSSQLFSLSSPNWPALKLFSQALLAVNDSKPSEINWVSNSNIFSELCFNSNLLSTCTPAVEREPPYLSNLGVTTEEGLLQPIMFSTCIPFLSVILDKFRHESFEEGILRIFNQSGFIKYIQELESSNWHLERSWYTRIEFYFLISVVKAAQLITKQLNSTMKRNIWKLSIKLISALPGDFSDDVIDMLKIALPKEELNMESVTYKLSQLNLNNANNCAKHEIATLYKKYITTNSDWRQAAMPKDWFYLPLVHIYTKCRNNENITEEDTNNILVILGLEVTSPNFVATLCPTLRFSRLVLTYLCDTIYLNNDISVLLNIAMEELVKKYHAKLNFTKDLPGLNSFVDLFTAMCEHFCSTSYGDNNFATILLILIAQRHDAHYRKLLWSEHAGVLRYLRLPLNKLMIPLNEYLYPLEEDTSLIETYITVLVRNTIKPEWCPVPYTIALHHSAMYLKRTSKLAIKMRTKLEKIRDQKLIDKLLNYESPRL
ncbi:PREDICTED: RNA polymerase II-associated protein 1 [Polistes canadensis]|uniref:RNA polymerase II-associated protein 1 n=1 Tax=Polistes canadensis TaxID=91411 RepID=UPI000718BD94|nr:PREDICTED: RNA polymerase II-associated protein 1 [Polistes canadensis]